MPRRSKDPYSSEEWQQLFMEQRSHMARAGIHASLLLNGGAAVALLAFVGQLAAGTEASQIVVNFAFVRWAFAAFGVGVFLAAVTYICTYFINSLRIHDIVLKGRPPAKVIDQLRWWAVGIFILSLMLFLLGLVAAVLSVQGKA